MKPREIDVEPNPSVITLQRLGSKLRAYNEQEAGMYTAKQFALSALGPDGELQGGMFGWLQWGWLFIDWAWVEEGNRRTGLGTALLAKFEALARDHGIARARLNTASFQGALKFYERRGYRIYAEIGITGADGTEHTDYFLRKDIL